MFCYSETWRVVCRSTSSLGIWLSFHQPDCATAYYQARVGLGRDLSPTQKWMEMFSWDERTKKVFLHEANLRPGLSEAREPASIWGNLSKSALDGEMAENKFNKNLDSFLKLTSNIDESRVLEIQISSFKLHSNAQFRNLA